MKVRNQTHQKEGKASLRSWTEEDHRPDLKQVSPSRRPLTPQDRGTRRHRSPNRASLPAPRQNTRVTLPAVKQRRVDNQGLPKNYPEHPVTTGSESPRKLQEQGPLNQSNQPAKTLQGRALKSPRRQNSVTETPQEPNTQEQQEGPQTCDQTTPPQEQVKDKQT